MARATVGVGQGAQGPGLGARLFESGEGGGILATSLFLYARNRSKRASELAAVDATKSSEVVFALIGEMVILGAPMPGGVAMGGIALVFAGLALFINYQEAV